MKNEHITPEEQIENQKATIQSLERKVESLERELQKCLDPNSGEINPALKTGGEASLLRKIQALESQLDDCVETGGDIFRDRVLEQRIYTAITSVFLPVRVWNDHFKEFMYEYPSWWMFRQLLFESELFHGDWSRVEFRQGVDMLNDICQATEDRPTKLKQFDKYEFAFRLFYSGKKNQIALQELIAALLTISKNHSFDEDRSTSRGEVNDMLAALRIVSYCQSLWIAAKEPAPEIATQD